MSEPRRRRASRWAALAAIAALLVTAAPVAADGPAFSFDLPAGWACSDFDLRIEGYGDGQQVSRELPGGRVIGAGTGNTLVYTNLQSGATLSTRANGAVSITTAYDDGTLRMALQGHNVVILFPADGGPSTTLYVGRVVVNVAADGVWSVAPGAGTATDICAALS
jgi:hypothetical protein